MLSWELYALPVFLMIMGSEGINEDMGWGGEDISQYSNETFLSCIKTVLYRTTGLLVPVSIPDNIHIVYWYSVFLLSCTKRHLWQWLGFHDSHAILTRDTQWEQTGVEDWSRWGKSFPKAFKIHQNNGTEFENGCTFR